MIKYIFNVKLIKINFYFKVNVMNIKKILENPKETLTIEFKREWYWNKKQENKGRQNWDEFLKDFVGLSNVISENKYFIIGVSDDGNNYFNYFEDSDGNTLKFFSKDIDDIKNEIIKKILNSFECFYFSNESLKNEKEILQKSIIFNIFNKNEKKILVIKINQFPFLLKLKKERNLKGGYREKSIIIRTIKPDGEPGCTVLSEEEKEKYKKKFDLIYHRYKMLSSKNTIKYIVDAYAKTFYKRYSIKKEHKDSIAYSNSNFFEIYSIIQNDKYLGLFIYFSKYSSIQKILENNITEYIDILKKHERIYIVFEEQRDFKRIVSKINCSYIKMEDDKVKILNKNVAYFNSPIEFIEKVIYSEVKKDIENELFSKRFSGIFVNPIIINKSDINIDINSDIDIILTMKKWIDMKHSPIFALIGSGGVGKTTIAKKFCSQIDSDIIFINSKDLISNLRYIEKLNTIYDFVKLFIKSQNDTQIDENSFSEEIINILVDSGKLLIVIDGLDEVILNYSDFDLNDFIKTIYHNCLDNLGKTKILLTIRDTFWKEEYEKQIISFAINGFNINKSKEYFKQKLNKDKLVNKALELLKMNLQNKNIFPPFILEIISLIIEDKISKKSINSEYISSDIFIDSLIYHICKREAIKFHSIYNEEIDKQIEFFIKMSIEYNGEMTLKQLYNILDENIAKAYQTHALLSLEKEILSFKFDILIEYFKMLYVIKILNQNIIHYQNDLLEEKNNILFKQICLNNQDLVRIKNNIEEIKFLYIQLIEELKNIQILKKNKYVFSFVLSILLRLNSKKDKQSNTELIKEILDKNNKYIGLCLSNNHLHDKFLFYFNGMSFEYCYIDYKYFGDCDFDNKTIFYNSIIEGYYDTKCNFLENNFDTSSVLSDSMKKTLKVKEKNIQDKNYQIKRDILNILKKFYKNSFKILKKERLKNIDSKILDFLIKEKIIVKQNRTTSDKRKEENFMINSEFESDLRLILENQIEEIKLLDDLAYKYIRK